MCRAALRQLLDSDRFWEWRSGLNRAVQNAFGNLPPGLPDEELLRLFRSRAAAFAASLPEMAAAADTSALADALRGAMLAARLNAFLPASVWRDAPPDAGGDAGDTAAFHDPAGAARLYDGQPRLKDGRFTYGKMPHYTMAHDSPGWKIDGYGTNLRAKNILEVLSGLKLGNPRIPGGVDIYPKGIKHTVGTYRTRTLERLMRSPEVLSEVFGRGDCREEKAHAEKLCYADRCWHIRASVRFNRQTASHIEFVVLHHVQMGRNVLYDVTVK